MRYRSFALVATLAAFALAPLSAQTVMGPQPSLNFGGAGIYNGAVVTNVNASTLGILLGLTATQRCGATDCGPVVTNDGVNTFFAQPGISNDAPSPGNPYGTWNFDFSVTGANVANDYYTLGYCFDPVNCSADMGSVFIAPVPTQNSWNLGMDFLAPSPYIPGLSFPPSGQAYDPTESGQYKFVLDAYNSKTKALDAESYMFVDVGNPPAVTPEPATMSMMAFGLIGMAGAGMRRRRSKMS